MTEDPLERFGPRRSDPAHASSARVYDYLLGGSYFYPVDKAAGEKVRTVVPWIANWARYNRNWVQRAVRHLVAEHGITQFLDIGSGIPANGNVHEIAREVNPDCRVVYVDYERVAVDIGREILDGDPNAAAIHEDMRLPESVLGHPEVRAVLDFDEPMAMIWGSMLHFIADDDDPYGIFDQYKGLLKPGDYIGLTHFSWHFLEGELLEQVREALETYNANVDETVTIRELEEIERFFDGTEVLEPGVVPTPDWQAGDGYEPDLTDPARAVMVGGVGRLV